MGHIENPGSATRTRAMRLRVTGRVQGVGFRYYIVREAERLGLCGYASNRADGSVEIHAQGADAALKDLLDAARRGPRHARVDGVESEFTDAVHSLEGFEVRF